MFSNTFRLCSHVTSLDNEKSMLQININDPLIEETIESGEIINSRIGSTVINLESKNAAGYFAGYICHKFSFFHSKKSLKKISECDCCSSILTRNLTLDFHLYSSYRDYRINEKNSLSYASETFINAIIAWERVFVYFFTNFGEYDNLKKAIKSYILKYSIMPVLCNEIHLEYIINLYIKTRLFTAVKCVNSKADEKIFKDKIKTLKNV